MPRKGTLPAEPEATVNEDGHKLQFAFKVNDQRYEMWGQWGWHAANLVRKVTGMGVPRIISEIWSGNGDPELVGFLIFLSEVEAGNKKITIDEAQELVSWDDDITTPDYGQVDYTDEVVEDEAPKDPASS